MEPHLEKAIVKRLSTTEVFWNGQSSLFVPTDVREWMIISLTGSGDSNDIYVSLITEGGEKWGGSMKRVTESQ